MKQTKVFVDELDELTKPKDEYSIKNCLALLESIEELSDEEKAKATSILKCELNREIFINFKNPRVRLLWVKDEIAPKVSLHHTSIVYMFTIFISIPSPPCNCLSSNYSIAKLKFSNLAHVTYKYISNPRAQTYKFIWPQLLLRIRERDFV